MGGPAVRRPRPSRPIGYAAHLGRTLVRPSRSTRDRGRRWPSAACRPRPGSRTSSNDVRPSRMRTVLPARGDARRGRDEAAGIEGAAGERGRERSGDWPGCEGSRGARPSRRRGCCRGACSPAGRSASPSSASRCGGSSASANMVLLLMSVPMAVTLWRRRGTLVAPRGFGVWLLLPGLGRARRAACCGRTPPAPSRAAACAGCWLRLAARLVPVVHRRPALHRQPQRARTCRPAGSAGCSASCSSSRPSAA